MEESPHFFLIFFLKNMEKFSILELCQLFSCTMFLLVYTLDAYIYLLEEPTAYLKVSVSCSSSFVLELGRDHMQAF